MEGNELFLACREAVPEVLKLSERLVNMDSGTDDTAGLRRKAEVLSSLFTEEGGSVRLMETAPPVRDKWNLAATFHGTGRARILILTHYDTVFPAGEAARRPFFVEGERAYGPGVADMQTSLSMVLKALPMLRGLEGCDYHTLTVFCNADEEAGSRGSRDQITALARKHDIALNMELSGAEGNLITVSGRGMANGKLSVRGRAAHSAAEPPAGVNAGLELAHQLLQLRSLSRPELRTAVNPTVGSFGSRPNVIPDHAEALLNIRVADAAEFARVEQDIREIIRNRLFAESEVSFDMDIAIMPYGNNPVTLDLAEKVRAIARAELGMELGYRHAIGGNDTSFSAQVCPSLDGFGPGCVAMHTAEEYLPVPTVAPRLYLLLRMVQEVCRGNMVPLNRNGLEEA
ncbi:M20/M25/M40 family metallo-hydrolase [Mailhella massiliensis]|uniref:M20/M25/M40 family metallo-hydrolase n=1 Tax=Mailhella massiliensis TaxID=1903261 RepID=A0A921AVG9_9BACT|nr:M20/M25/M40 family metallo-hydrolase [Mailhella massiliensis]HJD96821.1 M20/M25/M40 family metallo-hydrolase [Mailhella massiliensis]